MIDTAMMQTLRTRRSVYPEAGRWLPLLVAMIALGWTQPLHAQTTGSPDQGTITKVGTTAAQFIKLGVGARAIGMGGTFVAEASDLSALYWNPAGLGRLPGSAVQLSYTQYLADINYNYAAFGTNLGNMGTIALSLIYLDSGEMQVRTTRQPEGTGEEFSVQSFALQGSYARNLTDRFSIGTTIKYIQETVWHSSASAFAFDIGTLFTTPFDRLKLGANMSNFGPKMQLSGRDILFSQDPSTDGGTVEIVNAEYLLDQHELPLIFRIGLAFDAVRTVDHRILLSTDAAHPNDNSQYINMGAEYSFRDLVFIRGGYRDLFEEDGEESFTVGGGLNLRIDRSLRASIDYAYADFGRLESTHWFTLNLAF